MKPGTNPVEVAAALVFRESKLLITQRHPKAHLGGLWEFPGGKREAGESFEECLVRELREELGIEVGVGPMVECITHAYPEKTVHLRFYRCEWVKNEPQAIGCPAFKWVSSAELSLHSFPAADAQLIDRLRHSSDFWVARSP